jgi:Kef-type K+ transport system membrane component KefB
VASWPIGLAFDPARLSKPGELAYLVADLAILLPLALATVLSLRRRSIHAAGFLVATLGALAYDATHFAVRTAQEITSGTARLALVAALILLLAGIGLGLRAALRHLSASYPS